MTRILLGFCLAASMVTASAEAQPPVTRARGVVTSVDKNSRKLSVRSDAGSELTVSVDDATAILKAAPGTRELRTAPHITFGEINPGDRVLLSGSVGADPAAIAARTLVVMSREDVARKQEADREDWERGIAGVVKNVDPDNKVVTVTVRAFGSSHDVTVLAGKAIIRRYAPDSVKFSDAKPGTLAGIQPGDQLRARGTPGADNTRFTADEIVSGSFHNLAATIKSIDAANGTLVVTNLDTKRPLTVRVNADSVIRKLPEQMAEGLAMRLQGNRPQRSGAGGESDTGEQQRTREGGYGHARSESSGTPGGMRNGHGGISRMLERIPPITLAGLKPGDALIVASTQGANPDEVTAITVIAGVEPILRAPNRQVMLGNWNIDMNMGGF